MTDTISGMPWSLLISWLGWTNAGISNSPAAPVGRPFTPKMSSCSTGVPVKSAASPTQPASRSGLRISGSRLVWRSGRKEGGDGQWEYDIYAYDIESGQQIPVAMATDGHQWPAIQGDTVVWADNRNSPLKGTGKSGCSNCAGNPFDIYAYDIATRGRDTAFRLGAVQCGSVHPRPVRCVAGVLRRRQVAHSSVGPRHRTAAYAC